MSTGAHETARTPDFADVPEAPRSDDPALLARLGKAPAGPRAPKRKAPPSSSTAGPMC